MGQKVNPIGFRVGIFKPWLSVWYADKQQYVDNLLQDYKIRAALKTLGYADISKVVIKRQADIISVVLYSAKPAIVIGSKGTGIDKIKKILSKCIDQKLEIDVVEVKNPESDVNLICKNIVNKIKNRASYRRVIKQAIQEALRGGRIQGIKISCAGRLGGAEIARTETYKEGRIPLHKLRADIDYALGEVITTFGVIGIKVWVYKGDILRKL